MSFEIGKDARHNTELIYRAQPHDIWFHLESVPSPHLVFNNADERDIQQLKKDGTIYQMAIQLKKHTKYRKCNNIPVIYCYIKDVHITSVPGKVNTGKVYNLQV